MTFDKVMVYALIAVLVLAVFSSARNKAALYFCMALVSAAVFALFN